MNSNKSWNLQSLKYIFLMQFFFLVSCAYSVSGKTSVNELSNGSKAAIVSGCSIQFKTKLRTFVNDGGNYCEVTWKGSSGNLVKFNKKLQVKFVEPGEYEFVAFSSALSDLKYRKYGHSKAIFNPLILQGGDVVYIGDLNFDFRKSSNFLLLTSFQYNFDEAKAYLGDINLELKNKVRMEKISFNPATSLIYGFIKNSEEGKNKK
ncbi:MAG: hypothetical protein AABY27_04825 [Pseudomonadota bacterium]